MSREILYSIGETQLKDLINAKDADKESSYHCPVCKQPFILRQGLKKRPHFAHKSSSPNCTPESALHYSFKTLLHQKIQHYLDQCLPLSIQWNCSICRDTHKGNLLKKATQVKLEHNLGDCRPDIALLDKDGNAIAVIEVVVSHKPSASTVEYYINKKITPVFYYLKSDQDIDRLNSDYLSPDIVDLCTNPKCSKCGEYMHKKHLLIFDVACWKCQSPMKVAALQADMYIDLDNLSNTDIQIATNHGCLFKQQYSNVTKDRYLANTCKRCNRFIGEDYLFRDYFADIELDREVIDIGFCCLSCITNNDTETSYSSASDFVNSVLGRMGL